MYISVRKWRTKGTLRGETSWEYEVGEALAVNTFNTEGLMASASNVSNRNVICKETLD